MKTIRISRLHWPVTALGPGRRVGIWLQGCSIGCKGCCSRDTWDPRAVEPCTVAEVLDWVQEKGGDQAEGYTISGGEPFDQPEALLELVQGLRTLPAVEGPRDILVYSGYPWRRLQERHHEILALVDAVVSEPFVQGREGDALRGSGNQTIHRLTLLAHERYGAALQDAPHGLQFHFDGRALWMVGIPRPGDLERMRERLAHSGIELDAANCSWLA